MQRTRTPENDFHLTEPRVANEVLRRYRAYLQAGDSDESAMRKAITGALAKVWRKKPISPRSAHLYAPALAKLEAMVRAHA